VATSRAAVPDGFVDAGAADDFQDGILQVLTLGERSVGVVRWKGEFFALRNICPHQYGPVCSGHAMPMIVSDPDRTLAVDEERLVVICPWHSWEFDARTGRPIWADANYRLTTYPTQVCDGRVLVGLRRQRSGDG
jgi:nitrite reductase/ring-hydroxylating ferredoxin subunit